MTRGGTPVIVFAVATASYNGGGAQHPAMPDQRPLAPHDWRGDWNYTLTAAGTLHKSHGDPLLASCSPASAGRRRSSAMAVVIR